MNLSLMRELLAEEFVRDWKTYAVAELAKQDAGSSPEENADRLDRLTRILFEAEDEATADNSARDRAVELLAEWLAANDNHADPTWIRFKLRSVLYLHMMNRKGPALQELESLLGRDEQFARSPALQCLWGNLLGYKGRYAEAIERFDEAIRVSPNWAEPQLERLEKLILLERYREAANSARDYLRNRGYNGRAQVILRAYLVVSRCLQDADYPGSHDYKEDMLAAKGVGVDYRESWKFADVMNVVVDSAISDQFKRELIKFLRELGAKIRPENEKTDPDPLTKFG